MISRVLAADLPSHVGEQVTIAGWLHRRRELKSVTFLIVRDRSGLAQVVVAAPAKQAHPRRPMACPRRRSSRSPAWSRANDQAPGGAELTGPVITPLSGPAAPPPFDLYRPAVTAGLPTILDHAPTTLRHPALRAGFEIAAASVAGFRAALDGLGFTEMYTPKIVESATESGANVFGIDYFGHPAYLAQSPQFYKQALVGVFERVYRGRARVPGRAARHGPAPRRVHQPRRRTRLHRRPPRRHGGAARRGRRDGGRGCRARRRRAGSAGAGLPEVPAQIPQIHFADAQELIAGARRPRPAG